ncbi:GD14738 [Drosophila simulans]|uniref:GD14738 n=1 Tax=Drosophila simulans TaxID=7240 RepID=B4QPD4_DROSI|nr:GD14738 [Drosophila simulans]
MCLFGAKIQTSSWAKFYSIWCILIGTLGIGYSMYFIIDIDKYIKIVLHLATYIYSSNSLKYERVLVYAWVHNSFIMLFSIMYILAGIFMLLGIRTKTKACIKAGKILSYFFPIYNIVYVFPLVIHIGCALKLCRYLKENFD